MAASSPPSCPPSAEETMSTALASISSRREKASKALSALEGHRNLISSCIGKWQDLERSFGLAERSLQQKFKELAEREREFDAKMDEVRKGLEKRESSVRKREEASLARVKVQRDSAIAAILEKKKAQDQGLQKACGGKEKVTDSKTVKDPPEKSVSNENSSEKKVLDDDESSEKKVIGAKALEKNTTDKVDLGSTQSGNKDKGKEMEQDTPSGSPKNDKEIQQKDELQSKRTKFENEAEMSGMDENQRKRKDPQYREDEVIPKRIKEASLPMRGNRTSDGTVSLEEAISQAKGASEGHALLQLKLLVERNDGKGLREFTSEHIKEMQERSMDLRSALQACADPCGIVLKAFDVYEDVKSPAFNSKACQACILLLSNLSEVIADPILGSAYPVVPADARELAKVIARHLKSRLDSQRKDDFNLEVHLFLQFLATFGLGTEYDGDDLLSYVTSISRRGMAPTLCRALGLTERIPALVDKLIKEGKPLQAISFASSFGIMDKLDPSHLLKTYLEDSEKAAKLLVEKARSKASGLNDAHLKQMSALKNALKTIEECNLSAIVSPEVLKKRIAALNEEKSERKRASTALKQERKTVKNIIQESAVNVDMRFGPDPTFGIVGRSSNALGAGERGQYVLTDLSRPVGHSDYLATDFGASYHSSYISASRYDYERRPSSIYSAGYGYSGRNLGSQSDPYAREAASLNGADLRISSASSSYPGGSGSSGNFRHGAGLPPSNYPHVNSIPPSNFPIGGNVRPHASIITPPNHMHNSNMPSSNYLPVYRR